MPDGDRKASARASADVAAEVTSRLRAAGCVWAEDEAALLLAHTRDDAQLETLVARRAAGEPLEHLLGWAEFAGARVAVAPGVFVPRHRSEALVDVAVRLMDPSTRASTNRPLVVVDLCCGTGALGLALTRRVAVPVELHAADVDPAAVACARRTLATVKRAEVHEGDLFAALPERLRGRVDVLLANVPYVPTSAITLLPPEFRDHEHRVALDGGDDGLDVARRVLAGAPGWLATGGTLLMEATPEQAAALINEAGTLAVSAVTDDERETTVIVVQRR